MIKDLIFNEIHYVKKRTFSQLFTLLFPVIMYIFAIPELARVSGLKFDIVTSVLFFALMIQLPSVFLGKELSANLLADKDNFVLKSLLITPSGVKSYIFVKMILYYVYAVLHTFVFQLIVKDTTSEIYLLQSVPIFDQILLSCMIAFITPVLGLLIYAISKSKVDGNSVSMVGVVLIMLPVVLLQDVFANRLQYVWTILPNFGVSKYILIKMVGFSTESDLMLGQYIVLSFIMNFIFIAVMYIVVIWKTTNSSK